MSYIEKLDALLKEKQSLEPNFGVGGLTPGPGLEGLYKTNPKAACERLAEITYKILTGEYESRDLVLEESEGLFSCKIGTDEDDGSFILCKICLQQSYNPSDIENRYCGLCREYHPIGKILTVLDDELTVEVPAHLVDHRFSDSMDCPKILLKLKK